MLPCGARIRGEEEEDQRQKKKKRQKKKNKRKKKKKKKKNKKKKTKKKKKKKKKKNKTKNKKKKKKKKNKTKKTKKQIRRRSKKLSNIIRLPKPSEQQIQQDYWSVQAVQARNSEVLTCALSRLRFLFAKKSSRHSQRPCIIMGRSHHRRRR